MNRRIAVGLALIAGAILLGLAMSAGLLAAFDLPVFRQLALTPQSPLWLVCTATFVSHLGDVSVRSGFVIGVCALFIARHCWRSAAVYLAIVVASIAGHVGAKLAFARARPRLTPWLDHVTDYSYPSGHAAGAMVVLLAAALLVRERWLRWPVIAVAVAIGVTRPMLGVHWPSDVIGGWMWGAGFALIGAGVATKMRLPRPKLVEA